jgi:hypothetical protein
MNAEALLAAVKEVGLDISAETTKYIFFFLATVIIT